MKRLLTVKALLVALLVISALLFLAPLGTALLLRKDPGELSIPEIATQYWQAAVAALLVSSFGAASVLLLRRLERNSLMTMVASDAAQVAARSVLYRVQYEVQSVSKSRIGPVVDWKGVTRLFDLMKDDKLEEMVFEFYERLDRAAPCFARAFEAAFPMQESALEFADAQRALVGKKRVTIVLDDLPELADLAKKHNAHVRTVRVAQGTGLTFLGKAKAEAEERPIELLAGHIVEGCRRALGRGGTWYPCRRANVAIERFDKLRGILDAGDMPGRNADYGSRQAFLSRHGISGDPWWESALGVPKKECDENRFFHEGQG